jgi:hypothetical protein
MTIWPTRSWSERVAKVLSTQRRCLKLSGSLGPGDLGDVRTWPELIDGVGGATALHAAVAAAIETARAARMCRVVMLEDTSREIQTGFGCV